REKTPEKSDPIFPVPPMIPTFMASLLNDTLPDRNPKMPASLEHPAKDTVSRGERDHRDRYPVLTDKADRLCILEDKARLHLPGFCLDQQQRPVLDLDPAYPGVPERSLMGNGEHVIPCFQVGKVGSL